MTDRILTTHAGSLPKGEALAAMHAKRSRGETVDPAAFEREVEGALARVLDAQIASGVDIVNDGEVSRESFFTYVRTRMSGFSGSAQRPVMRDLVMYPGFFRFMSRAMQQESVSLVVTPSATGPVAYADTAPLKTDLARFGSALAARAGTISGAFVTAPSPGIIAAAMADQHYGRMSDYVGAIARAIAVEYRAILDAGHTLQMDAPDLAMERHTLFADKPLSDYLDFVRIVIGSINEALAEAPRERVRLHVCWGNYNGPHECDVPLEDIWPEISKARVGAHVLSLANPRHEHEIELFKQGILPKDATLVAGVIDTTSNYVEHPKVVAQRIARAVAAVGDPARVIAGTDCGFETSAGFVTIADDIVWAKLRALRDGAAIASQRIFG